MELEYSRRFKKDLGKIKHVQTRVQLQKLLEKLMARPYLGKPLSGKLSGLRSLRLPPYRIIYRVEDDVIYLIDFGHRKDIYERNNY